MFKKAKKLMCILLVVLMVIPYAVQASAYKETEAFYGMFSKIVYIVDGNAFYMSNEVMEKALTDEGAIIYLPKEIAGKRIDVYGLEMFHKNNSGKSVDSGLQSSRGVGYGDGGVSGYVDAGAISLKLYHIINDASEKYTFYFFSSDEAEYDESRRIGTCDSTFEYLFYRVNDRMVFFEQHEIDELTDKKIIKIEDSKIKYGDRVRCELLSCCNDANACMGESLADVSRYEYLTFSIYDANEKPLYEIYVNYDNYVRYENRWYTALEKLLEILERLYDFLFGFIL